MSERHIEMFWRCTSCQHRNLGRHMVCQRCKNAKDGSEPYEMPEDTASAVTVTDAALLRMATAGPHWRCAYCDSDQRALDGGCRNCGASPPPGPSTPDAPPAPTAKKKSRRGCIFLVLIVAFFGCCCPIWLNAGTSTSGSSEPGDGGIQRITEWTQRLQVEEVTWEHTVTVERRHAVDREGFAEDRPSDAFQVKAQGQRHHHDEQVLNGYETVHYTERKQSGYTTETYRDKEACGEDCSTTPKKCKEDCTSNKNGFATCKTTCTGGEKRCTTRYCSVTKTRKEPKYVDERRSRKEPRYRSVPHQAPWFTWKEWAWSEDRRVRVNGQTLETRWPAEVQLRPLKPLPKGGQERTSRSASYTVVFQADGEASVQYSPKTLEEFQRYTLGSTHTLQLKNGEVSVVTEKPPPPAETK